LTLKESHETSTHFRVQVNFMFFTPTTGGCASTPALGPTHPPVQWVPGALSLGVERPGREADHLPPSSAEVRMRLHGVVLS